VPRETQPDTRLTHPPDILLRLIHFIICDGTSVVRICHVSLLLRYNSTYTDHIIRPLSLFSRSTSTADDDFFNEPSTMRSQMTAAAAQKDEESRPQEEPATCNGNGYDLTAKGTRMNHQAAPVA
jgi:hypothetical protein